MFTYQFYDLGSSTPKHYFSIEKLKDSLVEYGSVIFLPVDAYTNESYRIYDCNEVLKLQNQGIVVYWANAYDPDTNSHMTFVVFYELDNGSRVPLLIVPPPRGVSFHREYTPIKVSKKERKRAKLLELLNVR